MLSEKTRGLSNKKDTKVRKKKNSCVLLSGDGLGCDAIGADTGAVLFFRGAPNPCPYLDGGVDSDTLIEARPLATVGHRLVEAKICSDTGITCPRNSVLWDSLTAGQSLVGEFPVG